MMISDSFGIETRRVPPDLTTSTVRKLCSAVTVVMMVQPNLMDSMISLLSSWLGFRPSAMIL